MGQKMIGKFLPIFFLVAKLAAGSQELKLVHVSLLKVVEPINFQLFVHPTEYTSPAYLSIANSIENVAEKDPTISRSLLDIIAKEEKLVIYNLGVRLRQRYSDFLGDLYTSRITRTRTTDADVSKISGSLVNAGLWRPSEDQEWLKGLPWQPVPTEYVPRNADTLMMGRLCPTFTKETNIVRNSAAILEMEEKYSELFSVISRETGLGMSNSQDIAFLYKSLKSRASRNLTLPDWTSGIFPTGEMLNVTYLEDSILSKTNIQKKLNGGFLMQKILVDSIAYANGLLDDNRKIMLYSGDSDLFIGIMHALRVWYPHVPNVASALIFEFLHDLEDLTWRMKISYDLGKDNVTIPLTIPGCSASQNLTGCQFENLVLLLGDILPGDDPTLCGQTMTEIIFEAEAVSVEMTLNNAPRSTYGVFVIFCFTILNITL